MHDAQEYTNRHKRQKLRDEYIAIHDKSPKSNQATLQDATTDFFKTYSVQLTQHAYAVDLHHEMITRGWLETWMEGREEFEPGTFLRTVTYLA